MRDAERDVARLPERLFQLLTPGETQELYRRLARAKDWDRLPDRPGETLLDAVRGELYIEMQIQATEQMYHGPDPHKFIWAVENGSYGAAVQAMDASPNRQSWLSMTAGGKPQRLAEASARGAAMAAAARSATTTGAVPRGRLAAADGSRRAPTVTDRTTFPQEQAAALPPGKGTGTPSGQSADGTGHKQSGQSPRVTGGPR
jgi:hypothetical protein